MTNRTPYSVRRDEGLEEAVEALRRLISPVPSASAVIRQAILEKFERDVKPNGHKRSPK